jgi:hypothetical protein
VRESFMDAAAMVVLVQWELNCEKDRSMHGRGFSVSKKVEVVVAECRPAWQLAPLYITRRRPGSSCPGTPLPLTRVCVSVPDAAFAVDNDKGDEMDHACLAIFCVIFMSSSCLFGHAQLSAELASARPVNRAGIG